MVCETDSTKRENIVMDYEVWLYFVKKLIFIIKSLVVNLHILFYRVVVHVM
jgi:hypothetical protein